MTEVQRFKAYYRARERGRCMPLLHTLVFVSALHGRSVLIGPARAREYESKGWYEENND